MNEKRMNFLRFFVEILFFLVFIYIYYYALCEIGFKEWLKLPGDEFYLKFFINFVNMLIIYYFTYVGSIIFHEFGHLITGLIAKLKFTSFSFLSFSILKKNNKLCFKFKNNKSDFIGACNMHFEKNKDYDKSKIIIYYMGGIIFNFIFSLIFIILLLCSNNLYLDIICLFFICQNMYLALYNSIPFTSKSHVSTDMLKTIYSIKDSNYIKSLSYLSEIQILFDNGVQYKDMDESLFFKPKNFTYPSDILMAHFYIAYLTSKERYSTAVNYSKKVLNKAQHLLTKADIYLLKTQLINCAFDDTKNFELIREYWDKEFDKYMKLRGKVNPSYFYINYVYLLKVENNEEKANELLNNFYFNEYKYPNKKDVEEIKKKIDEINKKD